jgi:N-acetyl-anhydromuramyl-L-alanine amidase AmpD
MSKGPGGKYILPPLKWRESPNQSARPGGARDIHGIVMHATQGGYDGSVSWLCNPSANASAHLVLREDGNEATQLVPWSRKAWHAVAANQHFLGIEIAGFTDHIPEDTWRSAARIAAFFCKEYEIPPVWNVRHGGAFAAGITRHKDLGVAGGGHVDPITRVAGDAPSWLWFISLVQHELERGGFLDSWGKA